MSTKAETILEAIQGRGCLGKARHDEPVFVLRGQDALAPARIRSWVGEAKVRLAAKSTLTLEQRGAVRLKLDQALDVAEAMEAWQAANPDRVKHIPD